MILVCLKSQGSTNSRVCIDLRGRALNQSLLYVACSRVTSASGLFLTGNKSETTRPPRTNDEISIELNRQKTVQLGTAFDRLTTTNSNYTYQLMFHNVQSLKAHVDQIINDRSYLASDFFLFYLPEFKEGSRIDVKGSTPHAYGSACFVNNDTLDFELPRFNLERCLIELEDLLKIESAYTIVEGDFNSHFDDAQNAVRDVFSRYGLKCCLNESIKGTTKYGTFIYNIYTTIADSTGGRHISLTSYHDPLFMQSNV
ncbi:hypothetical protein BD560DRAFT_420006 [Blakeslea trispora]|nr:hypothetical protein BD560DRAFT_420006 [Blakeslea trispora]